MINCLEKKKKAIYKGIESNHTEDRNRKDISGEIRLSKDTIERVKINNTGRKITNERRVSTWPNCRIAFLLIKF